MDYSPTSPPQGHSNIRVMLVDDSSVVRALMARALQTDPQINIVATASDGEMAIQVLKNTPVDVIILDIEMPKMDGITALPELLRISPASRIIMASTLTHRNAAISLKALQLGVSDYVPKPVNSKDPQSVEVFYRELIEKVKALGSNSKTTPPQIVRTINGASVPVNNQPPIKPVEYPKASINAIAIAASTGGPQALISILSGLRHAIKSVPVFITQHMPPTFTSLLAEHLSKDTGCLCQEAKQGEMVMPNRVYLAPGDYHMQVKAVNGSLVIQLTQDPPVNFCRPAADPMFSSLAVAYRRHLIGLVLTGMGSDGLNGAKEIVTYGGTIIAQDRSTSVVWGMPGAVAKAEICRAILPLEEIAPYVIRIIGANDYAAG